MVISARQLASPPGRASVPWPMLPRGRLRQLLSRANLASKWESDHYIRRGWVQYSPDHHSDTLGAERGSSSRSRDGWVVSAVEGGVVRLAPEVVADQLARLRGTVVLNKPFSFLSHPAAGSRSRPAKALLTSSNRAGRLPPRGKHRGGRSGAGRSELRAPAVVRDLHVTGRLDSDSTGVLVLTRSGVLSRVLSAASAVDPCGGDSAVAAVAAVAAVEKEYLVRVTPASGGALERYSRGFFDDAVAELGRGTIELDGAAVRPAEVRWLHPGLLQFVLTEGRHRQIRQMCAAVGLEVTALKRVRVGGLRLGGLAVGRWRPAAVNELLPHPDHRQVALPLYHLATGRRRRGRR